MQKVRIEIAGPDPQARQRGRPQLRTGRQLGSPHAPERLLAHHFFAIAVQSFRAFFRQLLVPPCAALEIREGADVDGCLPQHIKIVNLSQKILQVLQVGTPGCVLAREKILDRIAKALDANPQFVESGLRTSMQSALVQVVGCRPLFEGKMFEYEASKTYASCAARQTAAPLSPLFAIELLQFLQCLLLALDFAGPHVVDQLDCNWIIRAAQFFDPMLHDLHITQATENLEDFLPGFFHLFPGGIGIHSPESVGERSAAADRYSQIMDGISIEPRGSALVFYEYHLHPS